MFDFRTYINETIQLDYQEFCELMDTSNDPIVISFKEKFLTRIYNSKILWDISYRTLTYWTENGIIDDIRNEQEWWRKFNIPDIVWIKIIFTLREFWFSNEKILVLKESLFKGRFFEYYVIKTLRKKITVNLKVYSDGVWSFEDIYESGFKEILNPEHTYINISINSILGELYKTNELKKNNPVLYPISFDFSDLLDKFLYGNPYKLSIRKEGEINFSYKLHEYIENNDVTHSTLPTIVKRWRVITGINNDKTDYIELERFGKIEI